MADVDRILIVGGGIGGLTLATALHRQGYTPELIERSTAWPAIGAGINLPANGVWVLRTLGLGEAVDRYAAVLRRWGFFDQRGELLCETDLEELWRDVGPCLALTRVRLQEALLTGAAAVPHRLGVSLTALIQDDKRVRVGLSDGRSGDYDLVVGADGIYSTVRELAVKSSSPSYAGQMVWRSIIPTRPPGIVGMMVLMGEGCFFGVVPMGEGYTYGFGAVDGRQLKDPLAGRLERFRRRFAGFGEPVPAYLAALRCDEQLIVGPIEMGRARRVVPRPGGPDWGCCSCWPTTHGRRRLYGHGGCPGIGRLPPQGGQRRAHTRGVSPKAEASSRLGPGAESRRGAGLGPAARRP
jgi:2-polyprenyl-6-methoxyphenol hydroxylase-like FAD-dependent oxidoreductase